MPYEMRDGDFNLFINDKGDNDKRPDMRGKAMIDGVTYRISAWGRKTQEGKKWLSGKIEIDDREHDATPERAAGNEDNALF